MAISDSSHLWDLLGYLNKCYSVTLLSTIYYSITPFSITSIPNSVSSSLFPVTHFSPPYLSRFYFPSNFNFNFNFPSTIHHESSPAEQSGHQRKYSHSSILSSLTNLQSLSPEEQRLLRLYGKMPTKKDVLQNKLKASPTPTQPHSTQHPNT